MSEMKTPGHGEICWQELTTVDKAKAFEFYSRLFGWNAKKSENTPRDYNELYLKGKRFGGTIQMTKDWGDPLPPSHWMTYISVTDVDETIEKVMENGGKVCVPAFNIPNVGRVSVINDPSGAVFSIISFAS